MDNEFWNIELQVAKIRRKLLTPKMLYEGKHMRRHRHDCILICHHVSQLFILSTGILSKRYETLRENCGILSAYYVL